MDDPAVRLRAATLEDEATLMALRPQWTPFAARALLDAVAAAPAVGLFIAEMDQEPVATIAITPIGTVVEAIDGVGYVFRVPENEGVAWLDDLHVAPTVQGRGVAVATIAAAVNRAKALGFTRVEGRTKGPLPERIVDRLGATDLGRIELPDGTLGHCYGKNL